MSWSDNFLKKWAGTRLAHEAVMVEDARAILAWNRENLAGKKPAESEDEMQVGDNNYTIYGAASKASSALPMLGATALGVGGTLAAMSMLNQEPTPTVPEQPAPIVQPSDVTIPDYVIIPRQPASE